MSVGARLKEERGRLGISQQRLADIAGVAKNTAINWEKDASSPTAHALITFAEVGADVLYILTGQRTPDAPEALAAALNEQLNEIQRELLKSGNESDWSNEGSIPQLKAGQLKSMLQHDAQFMTPAMIERAKSLLELATDKENLSAFLASDHKQMRKRREDLKKHLAIYLDDAPYVPNEAVRDTLVVLALEYGTPVGLLSDLVYEIGGDILDRIARDQPIGTPDDDLGGAIGRLLDAEENALKAPSDTSKKPPT